MKISSENCFECWLGFNFAGRKWILLRVNYLFLSFVGNQNFAPILNEFIIGEKYNCTISDDLIQIYLLLYNIGIFKYFCDILIFSLLWIADETCEILQ